MNNVDKAINDLKDDTKRCFINSSKESRKLKWPGINTYITLCDGIFTLTTQMSAAEEISEERARFLLADGYLDSSND